MPDVKRIEQLQTALVRAQECANPAQRAALLESVLVQHLKDLYRGRA